MYFNTVCLSINLALWSFHHFSRFYDKLFFLSCLLHVPLIIFAVRTTIFCSVEKRHTVACLLPRHACIFTGKFMFMVEQNGCCCIRNVVGTVFCARARIGTFFLHLSQLATDIHTHTRTLIYPDRKCQQTMNERRENTREKKTLFLGLLRWPPFYAYHCALDGDIAADYKPTRHVYELHYRIAHLCGPYDRFISLLFEYTKHNINFS